MSDADNVVMPEPSARFNCYTSGWMAEIKVKADVFRNGDSIYTADQLRAAVLAERERLRAVFEEALASDDITLLGKVDIFYEKMFPAAIRKGTP